MSRLLVVREKTVEVPMVTPRKVPVSEDLVWRWRPSQPERTEAGAARSTVTWSVKWERETSGEPEPWMMAISPASQMGLRAFMWLLRPQVESSDIVCSARTAIVERAA